MLKLYLIYGILQNNWFGRSHDWLNVFHLEMNCNKNASFIKGDLQYKYKYYRLAFVFAMVIGFYGSLLHLESYI